MFDRVRKIPFTVVPIQQLKNTETIGLATGFFYTSMSKTEKRRRLFLVTNRHVVVGEGDDYPDSLKFKVHSDPGDLKANADKTVNLYENGKRIWRELNESIDIAVLELDYDEMASYSIDTFSKNDLAPNELQIALGEDVVVVGYPLGFHDTLNNLPIARRASIASVYPIGFEGKEYFLIDANLHQGTSGSPVITKPQDMIKSTGDKSPIPDSFAMLLGVHSRHLQEQRRHENLSLNAVWFSHLIEKLTHD